MERELAHRRGPPEHAAGDAAQRLLERGKLIRAHVDAGAHHAEAIVDRDALAAAGCELRPLVPHGGLVVIDHLALLTREI